MSKVVQPEYISLSHWAAALVSDFGNEHLPLLTDEKKWQEWGAVICNTGIFGRANVPSPFSLVQGKKTQVYKEWKDWAYRVYFLVNNESFIENAEGTNV